MERVIARGPDARQRSSGGFAVLRGAGRSRLPVSQERCALAWGANFVYAKCAHSGIFSLAEKASIVNIFYVPRRDRIAIYLQFVSLSDRAETHG